MTGEKCNSASPTPRPSVPQTRPSGSRSKPRPAKTSAVSASRCGVARSLASPAPTSGGRIGVAEAVAGLGGDTSGTDPDRRPRPASGRRAGSAVSWASAACRGAGITQGLVLTQSVARQHDDDDHAPARAARLHRAAPRAAVAAARRSQRSASSPKGPDQLGLQPVRRQPAEGRDGPRAGDRAVGAGAHGPDRRRRREVQGGAARRGRAMRARAARRSWSSAASSRTCGPATGCW